MPSARWFGSKRGLLSTFHSRPHAQNATNAVVFVVVFISRRSAVSAPGTMVCGSSLQRGHSGYAEGLRRLANAFRGGSCGQL